MSRPTVPQFLLAGAVVIVASVCIRLGLWQLDRLETRREFNAQTVAATSLPPLPLDRAGAAELRLDPDAQLYRHAVATGVYDATSEVVLRGRSYGGRPGTHLVTPFRLDEGGVILVNRGWLPSDDGATVDPRPYKISGPQVITGSLQIVPDDEAGTVPLRIEGDGFAVDSYRRLNRSILSDRVGEPILPLYLQLLPDSSRSGELPIPVPPPELDEGPHMGYAFQWFSFAAIAVLGFLFVAIRQARKQA